ncbi:UNVERIFIED_CONTAM: hypothetical protein HDU68_005560 [Siphonaria sp. JEL0065]|nr:hypothetical protein HDU68_005560 [Siphonaria sp. JEL0065]
MPKAPSKAKKKDLMEIAATLVDFYSSIPEDFMDLSFLAPYCNSDTRYTTPSKETNAATNQDFWSLIIVIAKKLGPTTLLTHCANPFSHYIFSLYKANLFREAVLLRCAPHLSDAFLGSLITTSDPNCWSTDIRFPTLPNNQHLSNTFISQFVSIKGGDKEFQASLARLYISSHPSIPDLLETYDGAHERQEAEKQAFLRANANPGAVYAKRTGGVDSILESLWLYCGGADAIATFEKACRNLVIQQRVEKPAGEKKDNDSGWYTLQTVEKKKNDSDWYQLRSITQWESVHRFGKGTLPVCDLEVDKVLSALEEGDDEAIVSLQSILDAVFELANVFTKLSTVDKDPFVTNVCIFYPGMKDILSSRSTTSSTATTPASTTFGGVVVVDLTQDEGPVPMTLHEALESWKSPKFNAQSASELRLVYRGQFREACFLNIQPNLSQFFVNAAVRVNKAVIAKYAGDCSDDEIGSLMAVLWKDCGGSKVGFVVPKIGLEEHVNSCSEETLQRWKGKGKATLENSGVGDLAAEFSSSLDAANQTFTGLIDKVEALFMRIVEYCGQQKHAPSVQAVVRQFRHAGVNVQNVLDGDFAVVGRRLDQWSNEMWR